MKNDRKIKNQIKSLSKLCGEYLGAPNPDAYCDRIVEQIIAGSKELERLYDTQSEKADHLTSVFSDFSDTKL